MERKRIVTRSYFLCISGKVDFEKKKKYQKTIAKTVHAFLALSGFRVVNCFALSVVKCIKQK